MKKLIIILGLFFNLNASSQCINTQIGSMSPAGPYAPGDVVTVTYTLGNFTGIPAGSAGNWLWDLQHTFIGGINFGPGWRFENTGNIDWGTASQGPFTMSFEVTVGPTCTADVLNISMLVIDDCTTGGWTGGGGACCTDPAFQIYNGNVSVSPILTTPIIHY